MSEKFSYRLPEMGRNGVKRPYANRVVFVRNEEEPIEIVPGGGTLPQKNHETYKMGTGKLGVAVPEHDDRHYHPEKHRAKVTYALFDAAEHVLQSDTKTLSEGDHIDLEFEGVRGVITHTRT